MTSRDSRWTWLDHVRDHVRKQQLSSHAGHVALALGVHYMNGHAQAWPSQTTLAAVTGLSKRTVQRAMDELEQNGFLDVERGHPAQTSGNVYTLHKP